MKKSEQLGLDTNIKVQYLVCSAINTEDLFQIEKVWVLGSDKITMDENLHLVPGINDSVWFLESLGHTHFDSLHLDLCAQDHTNIEHNFVTHWDNKVDSCFMAK